MDTTEEIWKDIDGYNGMYQASNLGRIRSFRISSRSKYGKGYIINPGRDNTGYMSCTLNNNGVRKSYKVHRLIAQTFIENPNNYTDVNHINEIKHDNRVCNLEWISHKDNMNYGTIRESKFNKIKM